MPAVRRLAAAGAALALVVALAGCGAASPTPMTQAQAEQSTCAAIQTLSDELRAFAALDPASTPVKVIGTQRAAVAAAWEQLKYSYQQIETANTAALATAGDALEATINAFDKNAPIAGEIDKIKAAAQPLKAAYQQLANGLGCQIATPY